jgi:glutamyl-tRNA(Gln) amidotransferase subunit E
MYPETDIPPIKIPDQKIKEIEKDIPETLDQREDQYAEEIGEELASQIINSHYLEEFEEYRQQAGSKLTANIFVNMIPRLEAEGVETSKLSEEEFNLLFEALEADRISKGDVEKVLTEMCQNPNSGDVIEDIVDSKSSEDEIREAVDMVIDRNEEMIEEQGMHAQGALMGQVMQEVEAQGETVSEILSEELEESL